PGVDLDEPDVELLRQVRHAHEVVVVEVRLLHGAIPDRDALMQHAGQAVEDAALHVRAGGGGLHDDAAVDRHPHLVDANLAASPVERDFDRAGAERARALGDRDADSSAFGTRGLVGLHVRPRLEPLARLWRRAHAIEAELDRIHALIGRHLVDEAFDGEGVEHVADRTPMLELDAVRDTTPLDRLVGYAVVRN